MVENSKLPADYKRDVKPIWCSGCGDFGVLTSFYKAMGNIGVATENLAIFSGIGCSSRFPGFVRCYGLHSVHGRPLPIALGAKLANPALTVMVTAGDGDGLAIGGGHFAHTARKNIDITYFILDNSIYGMTKGQASPTSAIFSKTPTSPYGTFEFPVNPAALAIVYGATFVARGFAGRTEELAVIMEKAIRHKGFSFVQILSPCITFNKDVTFRSLMNIVQNIPDDHDTGDRAKALQLAMEESAVRLGVFYEVRTAGFQDHLDDLDKKIGGVRKFNLDEAMRSLK